MPERNIDSSMWEDPKVLPLSAYAKALLVYFITSSRGHAIGIYRLPLYVIDQEHGFPREDYLSAMVELSQAGLAHYDRQREVVWVVNMAKRQAHSPQVWRSVRKHLRGLFESPLIAAFVDHYQWVEFTTKKGVVYHPVELEFATLAEPLPKGCATLTEWLSKGSAALAEPLPNPCPRVDRVVVAEDTSKFDEGDATSNSGHKTAKGCARVAEPSPNPPGTGTGTGKLSNTNPTPDLLSRASSAADLDSGARAKPTGSGPPTSDQLSAKLMARASALHAEAAEARSALRSQGIGGESSGPPPCLVPSRQSLEESGLLSAVAGYSDDQLRHAIAVRAVECKSKGTLKFLNPPMLWGKGLKYAVGADFTDVEPDKPGASTARRYYEHTGDEVYAGGEVKI